ncbi:multidrug effflux MFS transporter [Oleiagrimonas sp. C23AA]|uniref:multidrug effflux MFS transporter n=1 Tax=Oleiagrimonas sp. C23AA TaxID=2719047 RepID=UPI001422BDA1|nr:multidrug effflux MFS transporter [Oleiagrimonas sp. C23AA]NII11666.1 multidrug effflux MFS transporter [Oleiagrimonas sp. C23AA]
MTRHRAQGHGLLAFLLAGLSMIGPFSIDAIFPGFPGIGHDFAVTEAAVQQTVATYLVAYAGMSLFHGALSDAYGRKPVIVIGMALYALASLGGAFAPSFAWLLVCRALQGGCAGAGIVVGRAIVRDRLEGAAAQKLMSKVMMIFGVAPALAPIVGAWLLGIDGWRGIFFALTAFALVLAVICGLLLEESHPAAMRSPFRPGPLFAAYRSIVGDRLYWPLAVAATVNFGSLFLFIASAPVIVTRHLGLGADGFPWLFVPVVIGLVGGSWFSGHLAERISTARTVGIGYALMLVACAAHLVLALALPQAMLPWSMLPLVVQGLGVQMAFPTITLLLLERFPAARGAASSVQACVNLMFNAVVAGVLSPLLSAHMLSLALGACAITGTGLVAWLGYRHMAGREADRPVHGEAFDVVAESESG